MPAQSGPTLCDPMNCSPPGPSVQGVFQARNTGVGCHFLPQGIFPSSGIELVSLVSSALPAGLKKGNLFGHYIQGTGYQKGGMKTMKSRFPRKFSFLSVMESVVYKFHKNSYRICVSLHKQSPGPAQCLETGLC